MMARLLIPFLFLMFKYYDVAKHIMVLTKTKKTTVITKHGISSDVLIKSLFSNTEVLKFYDIQTGPKCVNEKDRASIWHIG
jgi:hypothetical protein